MLMSHLGAGPPTRICLRISFAGLWARSASGQSRGSADGGPGQHGRHFISIATPLARCREVPGRHHSWRGAPESVLGSLRLASFLAPLLMPLHGCCTRRRHGAGGRHPSPPPLLPPGSPSSTPRANAKGPLMRARLYRYGGGSSRQHSRPPSKRSFRNRHSTTAGTALATGERYRHH